MDDPRLYWIIGVSIIQTIVLVVAQWTMMRQEIKAIKEELDTHATNIYGEHRNNGLIGDVAELKSEVKGIKKTLATAGAWRNGHHG